MPATVIFLALCFVAAVSGGSSPPSTNETITSSLRLLNTGKNGRLTTDTIAAIVFFTVLFTLVIASLCIVARRRNHTSTATILPMHATRSDITHSKPLQYYPNDSVSSCGDISGVPRSPHMHSSNFRTSLHPLPSSSSSSSYTLVSTWHEETLHPELSAPAMVYLPSTHAPLHRQAPS